MTRYTVEALWNWCSNKEEATRNSQKRQWKLFSTRRCRSKSVTPLSVSCNLWYCLTMSGIVFVTLCLESHCLVLAYQGCLLLKRKCLNAVYSPIQSYLHYFKTFKDVYSKFRTRIRRVSIGCLSMTNIWLVVYEI